MDTLSRKHRLRQYQEKRNQQQQQQQHQQVLYGKENHNGQKFEEYELECNAANTIHNNNNNNIYSSNNNNNSYKINNNRQELEDEDEEEEFKVFKVIEINRQDGRLNDQQYKIGKLIEDNSSKKGSSSSSSSSKLNQNGNQRRRKSNNKITSEQEEEAEVEFEGDEDVIGGSKDFSIVCMAPDREQRQQQQFQYKQQQQVAGKLMKESSVYAKTDLHCPTDTARSTGDSSGFLSEGSGGRGQSSRPPSKYNGHAIGDLNPHHQRDRGQKHQAAFIRHNRLGAKSNRSKVIEDIDHLFADVASCDSPTESSYLSMGDSTLTRGRELDYSTLCRDEFSSFIAVEGKLNGHHHHQSELTNTGKPDVRAESRRRQLAAANLSNNNNNGIGNGNGSSCGGPMLVGVHDNDNISRLIDGSKPTIGQQHRQYNNHHHHQYNQVPCCTSSGSSDTDPFEASTQDENRSSSSCLSTTSRSSHYEQSLDRELILCATDDAYCGSSPSQTTTAAATTKDNDFQEPLHDMNNTYTNKYQHGDLLNIFLSRIDSIKRLVDGDKSVTMEDLFGINGCEINVSKEHRTAIEFAPIIRDPTKNSIRVLQELEMIEMPIDSGFDENFSPSLWPSPLPHRCIVATKVIDDDFSSKLSSSDSVCPQLQLNWPPAVNKQHPMISLQRDNDDNHELSLIKLEESLLRRFLLSADDSNRLEEEGEEEEFELVSNVHSRIMSASSNQLQKQQRNNNDNNLVKTVRRHLSEFIDNYVIFQNELKPEIAAYACDWHQNWLFASKRPAMDGKLTSKRVRMSPVEDGQAVSSSSSSFMKQQDYNRLPEDNDDDDDDDYKFDALASASLNSNLPPVDLIKYSTLKMSKQNAINLHCHMKKPELMELQREQEDIDINSNINIDANVDIDIDRFYEAQEDSLSELYSISRESSCQIDVCQLLLMESEQLENSPSSMNSKALKNNDRKKAQAARLVINYSSTLVPKCLDNWYRFNAFGYLFQLPIPIVTIKTERLALIRRRILAKIMDLFREKEENRNICCKHQEPEPDQQVRFLVNVTNVELVNDLPVIQFCAKVCGTLPISVSWFSGCNSDAATTFNDISSLTSGGRRRANLRIKQNSGDNDNDKDSNVKRAVSWPIEMHGNYDYEYQNEWGSWYRFKRCHGDLLFEIRDAKFNGDYNKTFKCVVENHCSKRECSFTLTRRQNKAPQRRQTSGQASIPVGHPEVAHRRRNLVSVKRTSGVEGRADSGHALLRTWSQRTMPRPQHQVVTSQQESVQGNGANTNATAIDDDNEQQNKGNDPAREADGSWLQTTMSRRSIQASAAREAKDDEMDKFGKDFPYYPENLLKRLEANKFLIKFSNPQKLASCQLQQQVTKMDGISPTRSEYEHDYGRNGFNNVTSSAPPLSSSSSSQVQFTDSFELFACTTTAANGADNNVNEIHHHNHQRKTTTTMDNQNKPQEIEQDDDDGVAKLEISVGSKERGNHINNHSQTDTKQPASRRPEVDGQNQAEPLPANHRDSKLGIVPRPRQRLKQPVKLDARDSEKQDIAELNSSESQMLPRFSERNQANSGEAGQLYGLSSTSTSIPDPMGKFRKASDQQQQQPHKQQVLSGAPSRQAAAAAAVADLASSNNHHHHQQQQQQVGLDSRSRLAELNPSLRDTNLGQMASMELARAAEKKPELECKPRANVKSLISRFSSS